jgi:uncharacterized protein with HEPN domain
VREDASRLRDMLEAIDKALSYARLGRERFMADELVHVFIIQKVLILGQAASRLSDRVRESHPEVPWREIVAMRNLIVHAYFRVDLRTIWTVADRDLPILRKQLVQVLHELESALDTPDA